MRALLSTALIFFTAYCFAQQAATITVNGKITNAHGDEDLYQAVIVNARTSVGTFVPAGTIFSVTAHRTDTLLFSASGFTVKKICLKDSAKTNNFTITVKLDSLHYNLAEVQVHPTKNLREIDENKEHLGDIPNTDKYQNTHALTDPIDFLFERFNNMEESKRKVAQLEDEAQRRQVLKDLFHLFIKNDIINLSDNDFDKFIDYLNLSDNFIRTATDYELLMTIKNRYESFENANAYFVAPSKH